MGEYRLFFELLQVAIGNRKSLTRMPSAAEWALLFDMSKKQALVAIAFAGVNRLKGDGDFGSSLGMPETLYLKWLGLTAKVQQRNRAVNVACVELVKQYTHDGLSCCILKGQGNLSSYPEYLREARTPGDIDVWCSPADPCGIDIAVGDLDGKGAHYEKYHGNRAVIEYVKMLWRIQTPTNSPCKGGECRPDDKSIPLSRGNEGGSPEVRYHHIDAPSVGGVEVEVHFRPLFLDSPLRNWRLQRWFKENEQFETLSISPLQGEGSIPVPTASFNAVYQLCHIYRHLFDEGVGLRQLMDYYFVLRALHVEQGEFADRTQSMAQWAEGMGIAVKSNQEIMHTLSRFGMAKFASATMYVLAQVFEPSHDDDAANAYDNDNWALSWPWMICEPDEKEGKFLLNEIMLAGHFGKYDARIKHGGSQFSHAIEKTKHNLRLLTHYPEEVLSEPFFRLYHWIWRKFELWRW